MGNDIAPPMVGTTMAGMTRPDLSVVQMFDEALRAVADDDVDRRWQLVVRLHLHGGREAFDIAAALRHHPEASHRVLAADVLSQVGAAVGRSARDGPFHEDALALLLEMIDGEQD